jgi:DNA mismatch repair enzyme (predicted ATPase)
MKSINLPPYAPILMESTRAIGYSLEAAIADIIDNSITASATNIWVNFFPVGEAHIAILDDGNGMDADELNNAMQYGSKNPSEQRASNDLGRFGLGLKTASLSQCKTLTVISKKDNNFEARRWDLDYVSTTGEWSLLVLEGDEITCLPQIEQLTFLPNGTMVLWQNLDRLMLGEINFEQTMGKKMDDVSRHLSLVYHRYLSGEAGIKKTAIYFNNLKIKETDPFLIGKSTQVMDDETIVVRGCKVFIRPYILPHISKLSPDETVLLGGKDGLRRQQGFYVYRNKRLLIWGTWFRMMRQGELSKLARIQVDIPNSLDDLWTLDIKKSTAVPPADVRKNLVSITERIADRSKRTWVYRGKKETDDSIQHMWNRFKGVNGGVYYEINRDHPLIDQIAFTHPEIKMILETLLKQIERSIPLNQLYLDLNNDEHIDNEADIKADEARAMLEQLIASILECKQRVEFLSKMKNVEPFNAFPEIIKKLLEMEEQ